MSSNRPRLHSRGSSSSSVISSIKKSKRRRSSASLLSPNLLFHATDDHHSADVVIDVSLDNSLPKDYFLQDVLTLIRQLKIPQWKKIEKSDFKAIQLERLSGALTNCIYKVTYKSYYPLLLRLYGDVENIIDRDTELSTLFRLSRQNIGPKLLGCFTNGRFEEFLNNSITLNKDQIREGHISRMIARRMKELHSGINLTPGERGSGPKSWAMIPRWIKIIDDMVANTTEAEQRKVFIVTWSEFKQFVEKYQNWLYATHGGSDRIKESLRFCHNDTQYGNLLFYDKSQRAILNFEDEEITTLNLDSATVDDITLSANKLDLSGNDNNAPLPIITDINPQFDTRLTVIDFEYAGANLPAFDISNHFCEWMYDYHDPLYSYRTNHKLYPNREERLNLLNSYVKCIPGSVTPSLGPISSITTTKSSNSLTSLSSRPSIKTTRSRVTIHPKELPPKVVRLYNETIMWRSTTAIFWALWGIVSKGSITGKQKYEPARKVGYGPDGEEYVITLENDTMSIDGENSNEDACDDDDFLQANTDDDFDHLKYSLGKVGVAIGDWLQFGLLTKEEIGENIKDVIYLDTEML